MPKPEPKPDPKPEPNLDIAGIGEHAFVTSEMLLGTTEADHKEALQLLRANDEIGLNQMESLGRMFVADGGTEVLMLELGIFTVKVRVLAGPHAGKAGYITASYVRKKR